MKVSLWINTDESGRVYGSGGTEQFAKNVQRPEDSSLKTIELTGVYVEHIQEEIEEQAVQLMTKFIKPSYVVIGKDLYEKLNTAVKNQGRRRDVADGGVLINSFVGEHKLNFIVVASNVLEVVPEPTTSNLLKFFNS